MPLDNSPHPDFPRDAHYEDNVGYRSNDPDIWARLLQSQSGVGSVSLDGYQAAATYFSDNHATSLKILRQLVERANPKPDRGGFGPQEQMVYMLGFEEGLEAACNAIAPHWSTLIAGLGLTGEAGEVADILKKHYGHNLDHPLNKGGKFIKELGDVSWHLSYLATAFRQSLASVFAGNIAKLHDRYKSGFNGESSLNRVENQTVPTSGLSDADVQRIAKALAQELKK